MSQPSRSQQTSRAERWGAAVFGGCMLAIAAWLLSIAIEEQQVAQLAIAVVLAVLGGDGLLAAVKGRRSLASRIGPLP